MPLDGCATHLGKMDCCFLEGDLCMDCWAAFDNDEADLANAIDFGNWLTFFILLFVGLYNFYWFIQERKVYYAVRGITYQPYFGFAKSNPYPTDYDRKELGHNSVYFGKTKGIRKKEYKKIKKAYKKQKKLEEKKKQQQNKNKNKNNNNSNKDNKNNSDASNKDNAKNNGSNNSNKNGKNTNNVLARPSGGGVTVSVGVNTTELTMLPTTSYASGIINDDATNAGLQVIAATSVMNPNMLHPSHRNKIINNSINEQDDNKDDTYNKKYHKKHSNSDNTGDGSNASDNDDDNDEDDHDSSSSSSDESLIHDSSDTDDDLAGGGRVIELHNNNGFNTPKLSHNHGHGDTHGNNNDQVLICYPYFRLLHVFYPITTGTFAMFRSEFQLGKPLLVGAALHNLFEWGMITYAYFDTPNNRFKAWIIECAWIWFVICLVVMIPTWPLFASAEQATGIMLDFLLPFTWSQLTLQNWDNKEIRNMFGCAWLAHFTHLYGSIVPLMVESFSQGQSYVFSAIFEFLIFMTAILAHVLYTAMISMYQSHVLSLNYYPPQYVAPKLGLWMPIAFILGLFVTVIIPGLLGECDEETH